MIPYTTLLYYNEQTKEQSDNYIAGFTPVHIKNIEYGFNDNTPLQLVYASPSFTNDETKTIQAVLIYKVNKEYVILDD